MNVTVVIATYGGLEWEQLAHDRAVPSARREEPWSVCRVHLHDGTLAEARNLGAEDAAGDWLCFLDADDELAPGYLAAMAKASVVYCPTGVACIGCRYCENERERPQLLVPAVSYVERKVVQTWPAPAKPTDLALYGETWNRVEITASEPSIPNGGGARPLIDINHAVIGTLLPKRLFAEVGGFRELAALEDWDLWLRCEEAGARLVPVPDAVYRAYRRDGSRNDDQGLYRQLRDEAIARRATATEGDRTWAPPRSSA